MVHLCSMSKKLTNFSHVEARLILEKLRWENIITPNNHVCEASEDPPAHQHSINFGFLKASWENTKSWKQKQKTFNHLCESDYRNSNKNNSRKPKQKQRLNHKLATDDIVWVPCELIKRKKAMYSKTKELREHRVNWDSIHQLIWFL